MNIVQLPPNPLIAMQLAAFIKQCDEYTPKLFVYARLVMAANKGSPAGFYTASAKLWRLPSTPMLRSLSRRQPAPGWMPCNYVSGNAATGLSGKA